MKQCLTSLYANIDTLTSEIIVVDNASYDGCDQMLKLEFPQVLFVQSRENIGFSGANNLAFSLSKGANILFLNPDTEIQGMAIQKLTTSLEAIPDAGMVGAHLLNSDYSSQTTCITTIPSILNQALSADFLRKAFPKWKIWGMRALFEKNEQPVQVQAISGACMLARRTVIEKIGCFSMDYFMYAEDMDLCVKIVGAGWNIYFVPDAMIVHHAGGSSSEREESNFSSIMLRESLLRFFVLHRGYLYATLYRFSVVLTSTARIFLVVMSFPLSIVFKIICPHLIL